VSVRFHLFSFDTVMFVCSRDKYVIWRKSDSLSNLTHDVRGCVFSDLRS
jgi:hypothetical protein